MIEPTRITVCDVGGYPADPHSWVPTSTPAGEYVDASSFDELVALCRDLAEFAPPHLRPALPTSPAPTGEDAVSLTDGGSGQGEDQPSAEGAESRA